MSAVSFVPRDLSCIFFSFSFYPASHHTVLVSDFADIGVGLCSLISISLSARDPPEGWLSADTPQPPAAAVQTNINEKKKKIWKCPWKGRSTAQAYYTMYIYMTAQAYYTMYIYMTYAYTYSSVCVCVCVLI
jgi:hypothetical protein